MKISTQTKFALLIVLSLTTLFNVQKTEAAERNYKSMSNQEISNVPIEELATLNFEDLIAISNHFEYPIVNKSSEELNKEVINLPIKVLADLKFESLMAFTDIIDIKNKNTNVEDSKTITLPISDVADVELNVLMDLTNNCKLSECESSKKELTKEAILAQPADRLASMDFEYLLSIL